MRILILLIPLIACTRNDPNHLGNPLTWPIQAVGTGISNTVYNNRRGKVSRFVKQNFAQIKIEIEKGGGPVLFQSMDLARVAKLKRTKLIDELASNPDLYSGSDTEPLVVALMVHGD